MMTQQGESVLSLMTRTELIRRPGPILARAKWGRGPHPKGMDCCNLEVRAKILLQLP